MAGTNAVVAKKALIDAVAAHFASTDVKVSYHFPGDDPQRELIHGGRVEGTHGFLAMKGSRTRHPRDEELTTRLFIVVTKPGAEPYDVEARAVEIGAEIESFLSESFSAGSITGLIFLRITGIDLDSDYDDEGSMAVLTYDVVCKSEIV